MNIRNTVDLGVLDSGSKKEEVPKEIIRGKKLPSFVVTKIKANFNNIQMTITDSQGNVLLWKSAGTEGFKNNKKSTPFAASQVANKVRSIMIARGVTETKIEVRGVGIGRDAAIKSILDSGISVKSISEIIKVPHNGVRPKKQRRV